MSFFTRLTTPTHNFTIPIGMDDIKRCRVTYAQQDKIVINKDNSDNELDMSLSKIDDNTTHIMIRLEQEETKKFVAGKDVQIQIRVITTTGDSIASDILLASVKQILDEDVLH